MQAGVWEARLRVDSAASRVTVAFAPVDFPTRALGAQNLSPPALRW